METLKLSRTSFFSSRFFFSSVLLEGLSEVICIYFIYCCFRRVRPISDSLAMSFREKQ